MQAAPQLCAYSHLAPELHKLYLVLAGGLCCAGAAGAAQLQRRSALGAFGAMRLCGCALTSTLPASPPAVQTAANCLDVQCFYAASRWVLLVRAEPSFLLALRGR